MDKETRAVLNDTINAVTMVKAAFGAPGNHGYATTEGKALYTLYLLQVEIISLWQKAEAEAGTEGDA
jgi:hypothetical protein